MRAHTHNHFRHLYVVYKHVRDNKAEVLRKGEVGEGDEVSDGVTTLMAALRSITYDTGGGKGGGGGRGGGARGEEDSGRAQAWWGEVGPWLPELSPAQKSQKDSYEIEEYSTG